MKKIINKVKDFLGFNAPVTFGDVLFSYFISFVFSFFVLISLFGFYCEPIERYLYIENGVYLRDYSDFIEGTTDMYYERLEEYKQKRNLINN